MRSFNRSSDRSDCKAAFKRSRVLRLPLGRGVVTLLLGSVPVLGSAQEPVVLDQAWSSSDRQFFYTTTQGSQLLPYAWFLALERPGSSALFLEDHLARFGYLPNPPSAQNRDGLPVGFVLDVDKFGYWAGMTCAACHTGRIDFRGTSFQVDGAPTGADFFAFLTELSQSLETTATDDGKFRRFAERVEKAASGGARGDALRRDLRRFAAGFSAFLKDSTPTHAWGPARLDAFGMIFNRVAAIDLEEPDNSKPPDAPVSYPHLWDTSWHDRVQWDGSAPNGNAFVRLARNVGEVLGVFARAELRRKRGIPTLFYRTSANRLKQLQLEDRLSELRAPAWPPQFGSIDAVKAAAGKTLYAQHCLSCHAIVPRSQPLQRMDIVMTPVSSVKTDSTMVDANGKRTVATGRLEGVRMPPIVGRKLGSSELAFTFVGHVVIGAILDPTLPGRTLSHGLEEPLPAEHARIAEALRTDPQRLRGDAEALSADDAGLTDSQPPPAYKARPLDGIWATAPYLHNGSVPTLFDVLLPAQRRPKSFAVGSREFDPETVGFVSSPSSGAFLFDVSLPGNSNAGHEYGLTLTDDERKQLLEYLKTL